VIHNISAYISEYLYWPPIFLPRFIRSLNSSTNLQYFFSYLYKISESFYWPPIFLLNPSTDFQYFFPNFYKISESLSWPPIFLPRFVRWECTDAQYLFPNQALKWSCMHLSHVFHPDLFHMLMAISLLYILAWKHMPYSRRIVDAPFHWVHHS